MAKGTLVGCTSTEIQSIRSAALACIVAASVRGVSYSIAGRTFSFPSLESAGNMLQEANYAQELLSGARSQNVRCNFNIAQGRGTR